MNRRILIALVTSATLVSGAAALAQDPQQSNSPTHKSQMDHRSDADVAKEYQSEAGQLREKARLHRKLAEQYRIRTPVKGGASFENVARRCDKLAQYYEEAAKEAEAVTSELSK